jgi:hypothetical protein
MRSVLVDEQPLVTLVTLQVASGQVITCSYRVPSAMSGCSFSVDLTFLLLPLFDLLVGMDGLQRYSPLRVDCSNKWKIIPYQGATRCSPFCSHMSNGGAVVTLGYS